MTRFSDKTIKNAQAVIDQDLVKGDPTFDEVWWVQSLHGEAVYRVQVLHVIGDSEHFVTCTCPHGLHAGGGLATCYHAAAVELSIAERSST